MNGPRYFNGGKISHVYKYKKNKYIKDARGNLEFSCLAAVRAVNMGKWRLKVHGSCWMIDCGPGENKGKAYMRYDSKNKPIPNSNIPLEDGSQPSCTSDLRHCYSWKPLESKYDTSLRGKRKKIVSKIWEAVDNFVLTNNDKGKITVEICGYNFQKTPGIPYVVAIVDHNEQLISKILKNYGLNFENTMEILKDQVLLEKFLEKFAIEGFIVDDPLTGTLFKIRANMLLDNCLHDIAHKKWIKDNNIEDIEILLPNIASKTT